MADQNFRVKHGISIDTEQIVDVNRNINTGVATVTHARVTGVTTIGIVSTVDPATGGMGIVTFQSRVAIESGSRLINIAPPSQNAGFVSSYNLTLPAKVGTDGQVLSLGQNGILGFTTAGLYENRYYVSAANGSDSNDGRSKPFATIKKAAQAASFRSFQLPGGRFLDAGNLLEVNKAFIQNEVVGFITSTYPSILSNPDYDETTCKRDIGYVVDAIVYDLSFGGNSQSRAAGLAYWNGVNAVAGEEQETIAGFDYIKTLARYVVNNVAISTSYQVPSFSTSQSYDLTIAYDATCGVGNSYSADCCADVVSAIGSYVGIVTSIIGIGTTAAPTESLPTTLSKPIAIFVEAGDYTENNPILLYEDVAIIGDNLRNTIIRPQNAGKDLFRVRNGCYVTQFAMKDNIDAAGLPQFTFDNAVAYDDPADPLTDRTGYATKTTPPRITRSPYIQNCSILSFLGANGILVDGSKVVTPNVAIIEEEGENPVAGAQPEFGKSMVAAAFTMVSFGGLGWRVINDGYSQVVSCFQIFCRYGSLAQSGGYLSITNSATNFGLYALRSTGFSANSFRFDRGRIAATGTSGGLQTLKVIGLGRTDQDLYVTRFFNNALSDQTANFKPVVTQETFNPAVGVNTVTDRFTISGHPFIQGDTVLYIGDENAIPALVIEGLVSDNQYYVNYIDANQFQLYEDESLTRLVDLKSSPAGINTFQKGNVEFFASEIIGTHNQYQTVTIGSTGGTPQFVSGRTVTQTVSGGTAVGYALTYIDSTRELVISVEESGGTRRFFGVSGVAGAGQIADHQPSPVSFFSDAVVSISTYRTVETKINSTPEGTVISGVANLPETYYCHFHRPSIVNSSSHTWEYSGSGTDYNALPQNGGVTDPATEQVFSLGGRVYSSGTNELGDFKIGSFITAYNRTGNIIFNNKVTIGQLDSLRLSLSGGVAVEEFSTDIGLGDNEVGGALNSRISTQLAVRSFLNNRLGNVIDKTVSTNAVPSAIVQLNATGQINADLIPPKVVNYYRANVAGGKTELVDQIPPIDIRNGDTVLEPTQGFVLVSDVFGQFLKLSDNTADYNYNNGDQVVSAGSAGGAIGIVTVPTSIGYGTTGLVKGVLLSINTLNGGSGYTNPGVYTCVLDASTGIGTSARAAITVGGAGTVTAVSLVYGGRYYADGDVVTINDPNLLGGRSGGANFSATISNSNIETRLYLKLTNNQKFTGSSSLPDYIEDGNAVGVGTTLSGEYALTFDPTDAATGGDVDFTNDRIIVGVNTFADGDPVYYYNDGGNVVSTLSGNGAYYVKRVGITSIELYNSYALSSKIDLDTSGTGTQRIARVGVNTDKNAIIFLNHGFATGDAVRVSDAAPTGITTGNFYYVGSVTENSFTLHESRTDAVISVNGSVFNAVGLTSSNNAGTMTFTKQNVTYNGTVNTSSNLEDNYTVLASGTVDAANITSGTISPNRLGGGTANDETFLRGDSVYEKVTKSVGIGTTEPITANGSSSDLAPGGVGINTYYGKVTISLNRAQSTIDTYSTLGVSKFKMSTFGVGADGAITIKDSQTGDVDAATLGQQAGAYYLNPANFTSSIPISKGGTGLAALPPAGSILQGNGTSYDLVTSPTLSGTLTLTGGGNFKAVGAAITHANITGFGTAVNFESQNSTFTGIVSFTGPDENIRHTSGTASFNNVNVTGVTTVTSLFFESLGGTAGATIPYINNVNTVVTGIVTFNGSGNNINCTAGTQVFNRAVFTGITTFLDFVNVGEAVYQTADVNGTLTVGNFENLGVSTVGWLESDSTLNSATLNVTGVSTVGGHLEVGGTLDVTGIATFRNDVKLADGQDLYFGNNAGLISADGSNNFVITGQYANANASTYLRGYSVNIGSNQGVNGYPNTLQVSGPAGNSIVSIYHNGGIKFASTAYGINVTGTTESDNLLVTGISTFNNNVTQTAGTLAANVLTVASNATFSGNITASTGTITANNFTGSLNHTLTRGSYLTGSNFNNSASTTWAVDATSANTASKVVARDGSGNFAAGQITGTTLIANGAFSATSGTIQLTGSSGNWISWSTAGVAAPAFTTRSSGTKLVLYPQVSASAVDYALGIESGTLWYSVPSATSTHRWYGGTTTMMTLNNSNLDVVGNVTASRLISDVAQGTAPLQVTSTTQVNNLNANYLQGYLQTNANTGNTIVRRDASGNFSAGTITATFSGNITGNVTGNVTGNLTGSQSGGSISATTGGFTGKVTSTTATSEWLEYNGAAASPYLRMKTSGTNNGFIQFNSSGTFWVNSDRWSKGIHLQSNSTTGLKYYDGGYRTIWTDNNDGSGSGLDADLLDGSDSKTLGVFNYASAANWTTGTGSGSDTGTGGGFGANGDGNLREYNLDPFGRRGIIWVTRNNDTASNADGGWDKTVSGLSATKSYMSVVYVKRASSSTNGTFYHGCSWNTTSNLNGTANTNPYFHAFGISGLPQGVWCVSIGFIRANGDSNTSNTGLGGVYRLDTGAKIYNGTDYKWRNSSDTSQIHRTYLYYSTDPNAELHWWGSGFYEINGQEPTIETLTGGTVHFHDGNIRKIFHEGNDGSGSGLDADNLDGYTWDSSGKNLRGTEIYADNWFRNYNSGEGLYNQATAMHWYSDANWRFRCYSTSSASAILFSTSGNAVRGYLYADTASSIGFLNTGGQWGLRYLSNDGNSPNLYFREEANESWTGNPGSDVGKIEYHANRMYIVAGSNSTYVCQFRRDGTDVCRVENDGSIVSSGTVTANSDIKLKTNIKTIDNAIAKVLQLRGVEYDRLDMDNEHQIGVIAQEVEKVIPEVVKDNVQYDPETGEEDTIKSVNYGNMVALLIEAVKEQNATINTLKEELQALKAKLED